MDKKMKDEDLKVKVTDLRVGNWYHNNFTGQDYQVWPSFFSQATRFGKKMDVTLEDISCTPIQLTDKILKLNGFNYYHKNFASLSPEHPFKPQMIELPDENGNGGVWLVEGIIKIRFVHELQNALSICGFNKEICITSNKEQNHNNSQ